jgi:polyisoprenoid-binding protein YceI
MKTLVPLLFLLGTLIYGGELVLDADAASIQAEAHATGHKFQVFPQNFTCHIALDDEGAITKADFSCKISDLTTNKKKRDVEMFHWLESDAFPELAFVMDHLEVRGEQQVMVGNVSMHNQVVEMEFPVTLSEQNGVVLIDGKGMLDTRKFDLPIIKKMGFLTVKPEVEVSFHLVGAR